MAAGLEIFRVSSSDLILNLCTAIGAWGGFPAPPEFFTNAVAKYDWLKWGLTVALIYQGGGEQSVELAAEVTFILYLITEISKWKKQGKDINKELVKLITKPRVIAIALFLWYKPVTL